MTLRVLGPVELTGAAGPIALGGRVPSRILTGLASQVEHVVSEDLLVEMAWGQESPPSAERSLQSHVTRLRLRLKEADSSIRIEHEQGCYFLVRAADQVDHMEFDRLIEQSRNESPRAAIPLLRQALSLWRNRVPFLDLRDTYYPAAEAARLVELRSSAHEQLIAHLTDSGDHVGAIAEAEYLRRIDPYRENVWCLLMVALYRQGRQADALDAFRRVQLLLRGGLGLEPGPMLHSVQSQILTHDPALLRPIVGL